MFYPAFIQYSTIQLQLKMKNKIPRLVFWLVGVSFHKKLIRAEIKACRKLKLVFNLSLMKLSEEKIIMCLIFGTSQLANDPVPAAWVCPARFGQFGQLMLLQPKYALDTKLVFTMSVRRNPMKVSPQKLRKNPQNLLHFPIY